LFYLLISRELFETLLTPKLQRQQAGHSFDHSQIADLLVAKDRELRFSLQQAQEQEEIQKRIEQLKLEVEKQDEDIRQLQKHLRDAEHVLVSIYDRR